MIQTLENAVHRLASTMDLPVFTELGPIPPRVLSGKEIERRRGETNLLEKAEFFWEKKKVSQNARVTKLSCSRKSIVSQTQITRAKGNVSATRRALMSASA